jgi:hypothetical protein
MQPKQPFASPRTAGWEARLGILKRDAEHKILEPLRLHKWTAEIEREAGENLIIVAERGGHTHRIALIYSSSTDNAVYKTLATQVEHIFFNGQPYLVEQYTRGVEKPVSSVEAFHNVMLEWNKTSAEGKFAPDSEDSEDGEDEPPPYRFLLAEEPLESIWLRVRQFQSVKLAKKLVLRRAQAAGVELNDMAAQSKAEGLAFSLRNAQDYFQIQESGNVSQRILNLYYGVMAFTFAEMLASPQGPTTLSEIEDSTKRGHGIYTVDGPSGGLEDLIVGVLPGGFFASWMKFKGYKTSAFPAERPKTLEAVLSLPPEHRHSVEDLFASIPEVSDFFRDIFEGKPRWVRPHYDQMANHAFRLSGPQERVERSYVDLVDDSARLDRDDIALFPGPISEISRIESGRGGRVFRVAIDHTGLDVWWKALSVHHSPFERDALIQPIFGVVTEYRATCLALLYALSIVVRYRPSIWRQVQGGDLDHLRVLIEGFLAVVERVLPEQYLAQVLDQPVFAKLPGSFF